MIGKVLKWIVLIYFVTNSSKVSLEVFLAKESDDSVDESVAVT